MNLKTILSTTKIYDIVATKLEKKIDADFTKLGTLRIKHQITINLIGKLLSLIEPTFMLFHALLKGYDKVPHIMTFYENYQFNQVLSDFMEEKYNLRKTLGLPNMGKLGLTKEEKKTLSKCYIETSDEIKSILKEWADTYENLRIIYGKSKHGLSYLINLGKSNDESSITNFEDSIAVFPDMTKQSN